MSELDQSKELAADGIAIANTVKELMIGMGADSYEITKKNTTSELVQAEFNFKYMGVDCQGVVLMFFIDGYTFITYTGFKLGKKSSVMDEVYDSLILLTK